MQVGPNEPPLEPICPLFGCRTRAVRLRSELRHDDRLVAVARAKLVEVRAQVAHMSRVPAEIVIRAEPLKGSVHAGARCPVAGREFSGGWAGRIDPGDR